MPGAPQCGFVTICIPAPASQCARQYLHRHATQTPLVITAGQPGPSILPRAFSKPERASAFRRPYRQNSVEPDGYAECRRRRRALLRREQPPCGPTFVSIPIDDWTRPPQRSRPAA